MTVNADSGNNIIDEPAAAALGVSAYGSSEEHLNLGTGSMPPSATRRESAVLRNKLEGMELSVLSKKDWFGAVLTSLTDIE